MDNEICFRKFIASIMTIFLAISIANIGVNIIVSTQSDVNSDTNFWSFLFLVHFLHIKSVNIN